MTYTPADKKTLLSWSSGKDSAWTLYELRRKVGIDVVGLLTTINQSADRVAMHAVRRDLLRRQAAAAGLCLIEVELPWPCDNETYEGRVQAALQLEVAEHDVTHIAFGDLFLEDVRDYRERQMTALELIPLFPLWGRETGQLAHEMIDGGLQARVTCVDPRQLDASFAGACFDHAFLQQLPTTVDPCGENGEFHTFVWDGPMFTHPVTVQSGVILERDGFVFADLQPVHEDSV